MFVPEVETELHAPWQPSVPAVSWGTAHAVSLYKIGETYFVRDGNHRISVAKYHKVAAIDTDVVELRGQMRTEAMHPAVRTAHTPTSITTPS
jgi:hypothetical protein